ncbi:DUF6801 domain-containing protein [Actinomadura gamaensis]|uniref:DUF6801 domain-containing protein n=1 Tax=Actinomadura gamaensis TaxID=1763541 RepID=A0ABV9U300_9ACTN
MRLSPTPRRARAAVVAAVLLGALLTVLSAGRPDPASAQSPGPKLAAPDGVTLGFTCDYPLIGKQDLDVTIKLNVPRVVVAGSNFSDHTRFDTVATVSPKTTTGLRAQDAATIEGTALAKATVVLPTQQVHIKSSASMVKTKVPPGGGFRVQANGTAPSFESDDPGDGRIELTSLTLTPLLLKADGSLTDLGKDFDVACTQTRGSNVLAQFKVVASDTVPPTKPGAPAVVAQSPTSATLAWTPSTDDVGVKGYNVYDGTKRVASVYDGDTLVEVDGLAAGPHDFTVKALDLGDNPSAASDPTTVQIGADIPEKVPPTAPTGLRVPVDGDPPKPLVGGTWARLEWTASTDNVGVAEYEILSGGKVVATAPATDQPWGWVQELTPLSTYTFTVRARDAAGNVSQPSNAITVHTGKGPPSGCGVYPGAPADLSSHGCLYMAGFNNVNKLDGAAIVNDPKQDPVFANVAFKTVEQKYIKARFRFASPPRSKTTLLTFGFMPTTATMELDQIGDGEMDGTYKGDGYDVTATATVRVRIYDAKANGAVVDVGPRCRSRTPMKITLTAKSADFKDILDGGLLTGTVTIPAFSGCGVGEDMNRLFNHAISGPGNLLKIRQGPICKVESEECPPVEPQR